MKQLSYAVRSSDFKMENIRPAKGIFLSVSFSYLLYIKTSSFTEKELFVVFVFFLFET